MLNMLSPRIRLKISETTNNLSKTTKVRNRITYTTHTLLRPHTPPCVARITAVWHASHNEPDTNPILTNYLPVLIRRIHRHPWNF